VLFGGLQLGHGGRVNNVYLIDFDTMVGQVFLHYNNLKLECSLTERDKVVQAMQWMQWTTSSNLQAIVEVWIYKCIVSLVPGVDQTGEASGSPLAIRENIPFCLLPQPWAGSTTGAGHWGRRYDEQHPQWHVDPRCQVCKVEGGEWWCTCKCVTGSTSTFESVVL